MSGNYLPRNTLVESLGHAMLKLSGWKIEGQLPALDKFVVIGAHHTSNWDFVAFLAAKFVLRLNARWFGKHTLFNGPLGGLMRRWGGIPIQRHLKLNTVDQAIQAFREHREFMLIIAPEGTRKKVDRWRMGFYHIARGAGVPVVPAALDYEKPADRHRRTLLADRQRGRRPVQPDRLLPAVHPEKAALRIPRRLKAVTLALPAALL